MSNDIHAAFEANVSQVGEFYFEKDAAGEYINSYARTAWIVWQARDAEIAALSAQSRALRAVVQHWNEFGPKEGFAEVVDAAEKLLESDARQIRGDGGKEGK